MKKDLDYYEKGIKEGSIIDLKGLKPGDPVYRVWGKCKGYDCPFNGGYGDSRCKGSPDNCKAYIEKTTFNYCLINNLNKNIFKDYDKAIKVRDRLNNKENK